MPTSGPARRHDSVQQDWRAILPYAKGSLFSRHTSELRNAYIMMSVSLDEAISLQRDRDCGKACQEIGVVGQLCSRLALRMSAVVHAMRPHARHFGIEPNLSPSIRRISRVRAGSAPPAAAI